MEEDTYAETRRRLDDDARHDLDERAAIMEFDGGLSREAAERAALALWREGRG